MSLSSAEKVLRKLYEGEKIRTSFSSASLRETFRKTLYAKKKDQDEALSVLLEEPKKLLRISFENYTEERFYLTCWLEEEKEPFLSFEVLEREEKKDANVSNNLD